jgi:hypothetical protein
VYRLARASRVGNRAVRSSLTENARSMSRPANPATSRAATRMASVSAVAVNTNANPPSTRSAPTR